MPAKPFAALALAVLALSGCAEATNAEPREPVKSSAAALACPDKPADRHARARFRAAAFPALRALTDGVVAPIGSGRGADVVVRTMAARSNYNALAWLGRAKAAALTDPVLCRSVGAEITTLLGTVRDLHASLGTDRPDAEAARIAGNEAKALRAAATRIGLVG